MAQTRAVKKAAERKTPAERVVADITAGRCDGSIDLIFEAVADRIRSGSVVMEWHLRVDDLDVSEADLTLDEAYRIEGEAGGNWRDINPLTSARDARAVIVSVLQTRKGLSYDEAVFRVGQLTVAEVVDSIRQEVAAGPLGSPSSTTT